MNIPSPGELLSFTGRTVLVTGAGKGIGAAIAKRFAQAGADVAVNYNTSAEEAAEVVTAIEAVGCRSVAIQADTTSASEARRLVEQTAESLGRLDILINNAGLYPLAALDAMSEEEWDLVLDTNLKGVFLCTQAAARHGIPHVVDVGVSDKIVTRGLDNVFRFGPGYGKISEVAVANRDGRLRPGMFVEVTLVAERREDVPVVPREAVTERGGRKVVFVLNGQKVLRRLSGHT